MKNTNEKILVGIRPTGKLHLGHYFSVIKPALEENANVLIADYHAPNGEGDKLEEELNKAGVKNIIRQKEIFSPALYFRLLELTPFGKLSRMTQFKSKNMANAHLFVYPVLMAHDVVGYDKVIVGNDQKQHLEFAKWLLNKAGLKYPEGDYRGGRLMSLTNPDKKMSKSEPAGCLFLSDSYGEIKSKIMKAPTTPTGLKNLKSLAALFDVKWESHHNQDSKEKLINAIFKICKACYNSEKDKPV